MSLPLVLKEVNYYAYEVPNGLDKLNEYATRQFWSALRKFVWGRGLQVLISAHIYAPRVGQGWISVLLSVIVRFLPLCPVAEISRHQKVELGEQDRKHEAIAICGESGANNILKPVTNDTSHCTHV